MTTQPLSDARQAEPVELPKERRCPFDPSELGELRDAQPLRRMRFPDGHLGWLVMSHELARVVLGDPRFSKFPGGAPGFAPERQPAMLLDAIEHDPDFPKDVRALVDRYRRDGRLPDVFREPEVVRTFHEHSVSKMPFMTDPPVHTRIRRLLTRYFTVRSAAERRARIEEIVTSGLDAMEEIGPPVDLMETFIRPIPSLMSCTLLGLPESERGTLEQLSAVKTKSGVTVDALLRAEDEFHAFALEHIKHKRAHPGDDLVSELVSSGELSDGELASIVVILHMAADLTTSNTLGYSVATLLKDRSLWTAFRAESADSGLVVEELLRYAGAGQAAELRTALEDVELGGTVIKAFERVAVSLAAANRDPQVFVEPDRLDLTRQSATKHLSFAHGVHQCLGQNLVRLEMEIALTGLARRFPNLGLAVPVEDIPWPAGDVHNYGPLQLPVTW